MNKNDYVNHSGGCQGADLEWDKIGKEIGFIKHIHYRQKELKSVAPEVREIIEKAVYNAAISLKRPTIEFKGKDLIRRNWFQAHFGDTIFALSYIIEQGQKDTRGFLNLTGKQIVAGGTGWTVEMAIQMSKTIYVFDMNKNQWFYWSYPRSEFTACSTPTLTKDYAGIGTRVLTPEAIQAIKEVYKKTDYEQ